MKPTLFSLTLLCSLSLTALASAPDGWFTAGSTPQQYTVAVDTAVTYQGTPSVRLTSAAAAPTGFVTVMQSFLPDHYLGKRVRFSGFVKSTEVNGWAGLWMRIDAGYLTAAFDNMQGRPISGTNDWTPFSVVLDVSASATGINFGILMGGTGSVWLSAAKFEVVDPSVPSTDQLNTPNEPQNLDLGIKKQDAASADSIAAHAR